MVEKAGWEVEGFIDRLTRRNDTNSERLTLEAISHLRAFSRDCDALRADLEAAQIANASLRAHLQIGYDAMKAALGKCQATIEQVLSESKELKDKRLSIFRDLDMPLAQVGCAVRSTDAGLVAAEKAISAFKAQRAAITSGDHA